MIRISKTSKLKARSWSLNALDTCPGSKQADGSLVDACKGCYATTGQYHMPNVKAPRNENRDDWKRSEWVDDMVSELDSDRFFRWFDSGDMYDLRLAHKMLEVMKRTPHCNHWLPTRMHKFAKFRPVLAQMEALPNVKVRVSSDSVRGDFDKVHGSVIIGSDQNVPAGTVECQAYERDGKCGPCRACWDKSVPVIAYRQHGKKMAKVNANIIAKG